MELFLVRHGQSIGNVTQGQDMPDSELTGLGRYQAEKVAEYLMPRNINRIISSPLLRAVQTARPLANALSLPIEVWKELYEQRKESPYIGPARRELSWMFPEAVWPRQMEAEGWHCPGGETDEATASRAAAIVQRLRRLDGERVAVFAHGTLNEYLIREVLQMSDASHIRFQLLNASVNCFEFKENAALVVRKLNFTEHLDTEHQS